MLHVDIPTRAELGALAAHRGDICVSIYLGTTPITQDAAKDRIELKNQVKDAVRQLQDSGADKRRIAALGEQFDDLVDDDEFWRLQAHGLAVLATPDSLRTFRVPNALVPMVAVSDRYHLQPLFRAVTFPNAAHVLALAEGSVRLIAVMPGLPAVAVKVENLPKDAASAVGRASTGDRSPSGRIHGSEGQKVLLRQYVRKVDAALRGVLGSSDVPLVLAASQTLAALYRSVNTYPRLAAETIGGSPEALSDAELADRARAVLDGLYRDELTAWRATFAKMQGEGRATTDIAEAARAATFGAVETMLADMDSTVEGAVDENSGAVRFAEAPGAGSYGVVAEIASRVLRSGGQVLAVRTTDIPDGKPVAAILRYRP